MAYPQFEDLWQRVGEAAELELKLEVLAKAWHAAVERPPMTTLAALSERLGITAEDLDKVGDVSIEPD